MSRVRLRARDRRTAAAVFMVALASSVLSGCSAEAGGKAKEEPRIPAPTVTGIRDLETVNGLKLPLEPYLFSDSEMSSLMQARNVLIQKCMHGLQLDYTPPKPQKRVGPKTMTERRYGLADADLAAASGYHMPGAAVRPESTVPADQYRALTGKGAGSRVPEGGCVGEAERALAGKRHFGVSDLSQDLNARSYKLSMQDKRVQEVFHSWSACMSNAGYKYPDPMAAMSAPEFSRAEVGNGEVETAMADVRCKKSSNVIGVWYTVESAYQQKLIEKNSKKLDAISMAKRDQLDAARKVRSEVHGGSR
ncbi:hypothetical protein [Streptomyces sp. HC307]|uniref:hypothetical protein n=1 Tax=Streptomyces flavusporus TaxID=3385496 RepID=UPI003916DFFD